jgi:hypothetical protein
MYQQGHVLPVFSIALSRPSPHFTNDGYIALGGLPPVLTIGSWGTAPIEYVAQDQKAGGYIPTVLPYPQHGWSSPCPKFSPPMLIIRLEWYTITPDAFLYQSGSNIIYHPSQWTALPQPSGNLSFENQYIVSTVSFLDVRMP